MYLIRKQQIIKKKEKTLQLFQGNNSLYKMKNLVFPGVEKQRKVD